jgi:hypothetical protein
VRPVAVGQNLVVVRVGHMVVVGERGRDRLERSTDQHGENALPQTNLLLRWILRACPSDLVRLITPACARFQGSPPCHARQPELPGSVGSFSFRIGLCA